MPSIAAMRGPVSAVAPSAEERAEIRAFLRTAADACRRSQSPETRVLAEAARLMLLTPEAQLGPDDHAVMLRYARLLLRPEPRRGLASI